MSHAGTEAQVDKRQARAAQGPWRTDCPALLPPEAQAGALRGMRQAPRRRAEGKAVQDTHHGEDKEEAEQTIRRDAVQQMHKE